MKKTKKPRQQQKGETVHEQVETVYQQFETVHEQVAKSIAASLAYIDGANCPTPRGLSS